MRQRLFPAFTQRYPGVTIEFSPGIVRPEQLRTFVAGGSTPDLFMNGAGGVPWVAEGKSAIVLDDHIKGWGKLGDFYPPSLHASQWKGKQWGLPMMVAPRTYLWRRNVLTEVGISKVPASWEEVADAARRSTKVESGNMLREGFEAPSTAFFYQALLSVGKTLFRDGKPEFAGQEGITALEYLLDVFRGVRPPGATPPSGNLETKFSAGVQAHTWYNMTGLRAVALATPEDVNQIVVADPATPGQGRFRMPSGISTRPIALNFSDWVAIGSLSKAQDQAWELMKFLLEPENLSAYCESRYFQPPRKSISNEGFMRQPYLQRMAQIFDKYGHAQLRVPSSSVFGQTLGAMLDSVYTGKTSPKAAAEDAARVLQNEVYKEGFTGTTL